METKMQYNIKYVAMYLRKSRGDQDKDLVNHEIILKDLCKKYGWKYVKYCEVGTSDSIDLRPQMLRLLKDVEEGLYDAVCVVDYDRLSRGDMGDQDRVKKIFKKSNTLIITPQKFYDLNDELDDTWVDFQGLMARQEYKQIKKRLARGKKIGARRGNWTNGTPPYPYEYEKWGDKYNGKGLVVNDNKLVVYRYMVDKALEGVPPYEIAWDLNRQGIPSPRGKTWHNITVYRILKDETHLGRIISNKGSGDSHANKKPDAQPYKRNPRSEWVVVENCHEAVKTIEEHNKILSLLNKRQLIPKKARAGIDTFSGLIKCKNCNHNLTFYRKKSGVEFLKPCWYVDPYGNKCNNRGIKVEIIEKYVYDEIIQFREDIRDKIKKMENNDYQLSKYSEMLKNNIITLRKYEKALENVNDSYDLGDYTREEWLSRKTKWEEKITEIEDKIQELELKITNCTGITNEEILENVDYVLDNLPRCKTSKEKNELYKKIIDSIIWYRDDNEINIKVNFIKGISK